MDWHKHADPYRVWLSEIMLQQTVIKVVVPVYQRFVELYPTIHDFAAASDEAVQIAVRGLGYYQRFRRMKIAANEIVRRSQRHFGKKPCTPLWPANLSEWRDLPGIGDYTAAAITSICFSQPHAAVDGNVERVIARLFHIDEPSGSPVLKSKARKIASELLDPEQPGEFNQAMMELGQLICRPKSPLCFQCPLRSQCIAFQLKCQDLVPRHSKRPRLIQTRLRLYIPERRGKVGIIKRPESAKFLSGLPGFITDIHDGNSFVNDGNRGRASFEATRRLGIIKHNITQHRLTVEVFSCQLKVPLQYIPIRQAIDSLVSNLDRKALQLLAEKWERVKQQPGSVPVLGSKPTSDSFGHQGI